MTYGIMFNMERGGKKEEEGSICSEGFCLPKSLARVTGPCSPGNGYTPACPWEEVS